MNRAASPSSPEPRAAAGYGAIAAIIAVAVLLFAVRASAPANFLDKDQERPASYILDLLRNGHAVCQLDWMGDVTSKPPLLTWLGAALTWPVGRVTPWRLYLPSALALTLLAGWTWRWGRRYLGPLPALLAALIVLLSPVSIRQFILLRTDALFALTVGWAAFLLFEVWQSGRRWLPFWLAAALATLTKGPFGVLLACGGLLALVWEGHGSRARPLRGNPWPGLVAFLLLTGGWFVLAYFEFGDAVTGKLIRRELLAHAVQIERHRPLYQRLFIPFLYYVHRGLPWSLPALIGMWGVIRRPAADDAVRRFERFLLCWFGAGIFLLSLAQHQRSDLVSPMLAPAALLGGRVLAGWLARWRPAWRAVAVAAITVAVLAQTAYYYHVKEARSDWVTRTGHLRDLAWRIEQAGIPPGAITYLDAPFTLQIYLNTMIPNVTAEEAARRLAGPAPARVALSAEGRRQVERYLGPRSEHLQVLDRTPDGDEHALLLLGN